MKRLFSYITVFFLAIAVRAQSEDLNADNRQLNVLAVHSYIPFTIGLNYERVVPLNERIGLIPMAGFAVFEEGVVPVFAFSAYLGKQKHRAELGGTLVSDLPLVHLNYRYTHPKGFFTKVGLGYVPGEEGTPILALGYAF